MTNASIVEEDPPEPRTPAGFSTGRAGAVALRALAKDPARVYCDEIKQRWPAARVAMAHRTGKLEIGEVSVVVSVSCPHRHEAFEACRWGIDRLKESVPIWKKEHAADGTFWIEGEETKPAIG